jgi:hypothetical protein
MHNLEGGKLKIYSGSFKVSSPLNWNLGRFGNNVCWTEKEIWIPTISLSYCWTPSVCIWGMQRLGTVSEERRAL